MWKRARIDKTGRKLTKQKKFQMAGKVNRPIGSKSKQKEKEKT